MTDLESPSVRRLHHNLWGALLMLAMALTGCGLLADDAKAPFAASEEDIPELPIDHYRLSTKEYQRFNLAQARLEQRCMVAFGFADFPVDPKDPPRRTPVIMLGLVSTGPFGVLDLDHARRWGYGRDPKKSLRAEPKGRAMTEAEYGVLHGTATGIGTGGPATVRGRKVPASGCQGEAGKQLVRGVKDSTQMWSYVSGREQSLDKAVAKDERVRRAWDAWSKCLVDKGLSRYENPDKAFADKAWGRGQDGNTTRTDRERDTASADVECKRKHDTVKTWWEVKAEVQRADIDRNKARYEAIRKDQDVIRANIRRVLGE
ncbi:hypothetical protein AB0F96_16645 [Streptomyces sp. NPDC023998]|uniref:hypothetical protein n=1 Tax=Streptomyces sp. NPDC023998 TaxID=3154597 RepID=UPI0033F5CECF